MARSKAFDPTKDNGSTGAAIPATNVLPESTAVVVRELRPRQILAASLLVSGKRGVDVAATVGVTPETVSRWKAEPAFRGLTHDLLRQQIDAVQLGMIALTGEAISQLHNLLNSFSDQTSLKACALVLGKAAPILGVVNAELRRTTVEDRR